MRLLTGREARPDAMSKRRDERLEAFGRIVGIYESRLLRYAARISANPSCAEDVVQNAFLKLARAWRGDYDDTPELSAWLYRTVHNEAVDFIRAEERRRKLHREHGAEVVGRTSDGSRPGEGEPGDAALAAARALDALSERERQAVVLKVYEEKTYREIAAIMGISTDNVGATLSAAMKKLSAVLGGVGGRQ